MFGAMALALSLSCDNCSHSGWGGVVDFCASVIYRIFSVFGRGAQGEYGWLVRLCGVVVFAAMAACSCAWSQTLGVAEGAEVRRVQLVYRVERAGSVADKAVAALREHLDWWGGRLTDAAGIAALQAELTHVLRSAGYPIGQALVVERDLEGAMRTGVLQVVVYPGEIGRLDLRNTSRVSDARLLHTLGAALCPGLHPVGHGCVLESGRLERATQLLQDIPGVKLVGAPELDAAGVGVGQTHVTVTTAASGKPVSADVTLDNQGSQVTGTGRLGAVVSGNNLFGAGDVYNASLYTTTKHLWSGSAGVSAPLGYDGLRWAAAFARSFYTVNQDILINGVADTVSVGVTYPFVRGLDLNINGALDLLQSRTSVDYPDYGVKVHSRLYSVRATLSANGGDRAQQLGLSQWQGQVALTTGDQSNDDPLDLGPRRAGHYTKLAATVLRKQNLNASGNLFAILNVRGQAASKNLDYSEALSLGGLNGVRAYRPDEGSVMQGVIASLDLKWRFPVPFSGQLLPGVLFDYATGQVNRDPWPGWQSGYPGVPGVSNHRSLAGYGVSLDWVAANGLTTSLAWARRFGFSGDSWVEPGSANSRFWLTFSWRH
jgi:hemolysin activation/secretion protein